MNQKRFHIIIDISNVSDNKLNDKSGLKNFLNHIPSTIDMSVLAGPLIANGIPENPGLSGFVIIDYSHISIHTFTKTDEALIDIFSCKPYEKEVAIKEVLQYFDVKKSDMSIKTVSWG